MESARLLPGGRWLVVHGTEPSSTPGTKIATIRVWDINHPPDSKETSNPLCSFSWPTGNTPLPHFQLDESDGTVHIFLFGIGRVLILRFTPTITPYLVLLRELTDPCPDLRLPVISGQLVAFGTAVGNEFLLADWTTGHSRRVRLCDGGPQVHSFV